MVQNCGGERFFINCLMLSLLVLISSSSSLATTTSVLLTHGPLVGFCEGNISENLGPDQYLRSSAT